MATKKDSGDRVQLPLGFLVPESSWTAPNLDDLPQDWNAFKRVGIDTETRDPTLRALGCGARRGGYAVGASIAFEDGPSFYLPVRHGGGGNLDPEKVFGYLRHQAKNFSGTLVGGNLPYDLDYLENEQILFPAVRRFADVLVAEPLIDELQDDYDLDSVCKRQIGVGKNEDMLVKAAQAYGAKTAAEVKGILWALPAHLVGPYAQADAWLPLKTLRVQERQIADQELDRVWDLECRFLPVAYRMRRRGVLIDQDQLAKVEAWTRSQESAHLAEVHRLTGIRIAVGDTMKAGAVAPALQAVGFNPPVDAKGKPSIDVAVLGAVNHPVGALIRQARQMDKLRSTYVASIVRHMTNGRIHCTFNQLKAQEDEDSKSKGTITGRPSAVSPNLLNQPSPKREPELATFWRSIYLPEPGSEWCAADYSQQEPRWLVHWSVLAGGARIGDHAWAAAKEAMRLYNEDPATDFHNMTAAMASIKRQSAKTLGLGKIYGMGGVKLCRQLGLPTQFVPEMKWIGRGQQQPTGRMVEVAGEEGQRIIDAFNAKVPFADRMLKADSHQAKELGFIRTHSGRRGRFERNDKGEYQWTHKALNKRIQGSAADQTKEACVQLEEAGIYLQIQIYDETDSSVANRGQVETIRDIMENCIKMKVPSKTDIAVGPNWGQAA